MNEQAPDGGFIGAWKSLGLSNRVAHLTTLLHGKLQNGRWVESFDQELRATSGMKPLNLRSNCQDGWIVDELQDLQGSEYRRRQAELVGLCLRAAIIELDHLVRDQVGHGSTTHETAKLVEADRAREVSIANLLPTLDAPDSDASLPGVTSHFGSIAFHKAEPPTETHYKENLGHFDGLWPESPPAFHQELTTWIQDLGSADAPANDPYVSRLENLLEKDADLNERWEDGSLFQPGAARLFFQRLVSPLLEHRQSMFLAEVGSQVPLILIKRQAEHEGPSGNIVWLTPSLVGDLKQFLEKYRGCRVSESEACALGCGDEHPFAALRHQLCAFEHDLVWTGSTGRSQWRRILGSTRCSRVAEFQVPFAFFDQAVLISCARSGGSVASRTTAARGPVSLSLAVTPAPSCPDQDPVKLARWAAVVATGLQQLVTDIDAAITAIDQEVDRRRLLRHSLRSAVAGVLARSMAHNLGSHLVANALDSHDQADRGVQKDVLEFLQERMVWLAEVASSSPAFAMPLPLFSGVIRPLFQTYEKGGLRKTVDSPILELLLKDEMQNEAGGNSTRERRGSGKALGETGDIKIKFLWNEPALDGTAPTQLLDNGLPDPEIAVPSGILGSHAFYVIAENILRNAVKFGQRSSQLTLTVVAMPARDNAELIELVVWDSWRRYEDSAWRGINSYSSPWKRDNKVVEGKNKQHWRYIDEDTFEPVPGGGGHKEMRIACAWIRGMQLEDALRPDFRPDPPLMQPVLIDQSAPEGPASRFFDTLEEAQESGDTSDLLIGYRLYVHRAMRLAVVDAELVKELPENALPALSATGVQVFESLEQLLRSAWARADCLVFKQHPQLQYDELTTLRDRRFDLPLRLVLALDSAVQPAEIEATARLPEDLIEALKADLLEGEVLPSTLARIVTTWDRSILHRGRNGEVDVIIKLRRMPDDSIEKYQASIKEIVPERETNEKKLSVDDHFHVMWTDTLSLDYDGLPQDLSRIAVYDDHHTLAANHEQNVPGWGGWNPENGEFGRRRELLSYEGLCANSLSLILLRNLRPTLGDERLLAALPFFESALPAVVVADDRIQTAEEVLTRLRLGKVVLCREDFETIKTAVKSLYQSGRSVLVVMHYALFERPGGPLDVGELTDNGATLSFISSDRAGWAVRDKRAEGHGSGRKEQNEPVPPSNLPFVPATSVRRFIEDGCKLGLVQLLLAARRLER